MEISWSSMDTFLGLFIFVVGIVSVPGWLYLWESGYEPIERVTRPLFGKHASLLGVLAGPAAFFGLMYVSLLGFERSGGILFFVVVSAVVAMIGIWSIKRNKRSRAATPRGVDRVLEAEAEAAAADAPAPKVKPPAVAPAVAQSRQNWNDFQRLWSSAVASPLYNKRVWQDVEQQLLAAKVIGVFEDP